MLRTIKIFVLFLLFIWGFRDSWAANNELSAEALEHGKDQVQRMLRDRPAMKRYVTEGDAIWQWAVRKYAGEDLATTIDWSPDPPDKPDAYNSDHSIPTHKARGFIRVRETYSSGSRTGRKRSFEELWYDAVFELHNISNAPRFLQVFEEARRGKLSKELWIKKNTQIEYDALRRVVDFYKSSWLPWSRTKGFQSDPRIWRVHLPQSYDNWIRLYIDRSGYPWDTWGCYYDDMVAQGRRRGI
ncbi:MAG: hypothetical protein ACREQA_21615 [Candidatus Binatia bacterium]